MGARLKSRFWPICRRYFRRFRISVWLLILLLLGCLLYLNQIGLPNFIKTPLVQKLRARGLELQFSRLRVRWYQGIVAEDVSFGGAGRPPGPHLVADEVQLRINPKALARFQLQVDSVKLRHGTFSWPINEGTNVDRPVAIERIETEVHFLPDDLWSLDNFKAAVAGANIHLSGWLTNASVVREWKFLQGPAFGPAHPGIWQDRLRGLVDTLSQIRFAAQPELWLSIRGDAREFQSFSALLLVSTPGADTPWGSVSKARLSGRVFPATSNEFSRAEVQLQAADARSRWANITNFSVRLDLHSTEPQTDSVQAFLEVSARNAQTAWCAATNGVLTAHWVHSITNPIPLSGQASFRCQQLQTKWAGAGELELNARLTDPPNNGARRAAQPSWGWWTNLQPYCLTWEGQLTQLRSPQIYADRITCVGTWVGPQLTITNLDAALDEGRLAAHGQLDVATRDLHLSLVSDVDPHRLAPLLPGTGRQWLEQFSWSKAPQLAGDFSVVLPPWTNRQTDWHAEVQPTLRLQGEFNLAGNGAYREMQVTSAHCHFIYSNLCWFLPDLTITRPEGGLHAIHQANDRTKDFYWHFSSSLDPRSLLPFLNETQRRAFDLFTVAEPPLVEGEIWGRYHDPERTGFRGRVAWTNFSFRGEYVSGLQTSLQYTNRLLQFFAPQIQCATQSVSAAGLLADFNRQLVFLTNGLSTADPGIIARAIGPHIWRAIEPYRFVNPPAAHVQGTIPMRGEAGADLHFDLDGGPFEWWKFKFPHVAGHVHWSGLQLALNDVRAELYDGKMAGSARFDFGRAPAGLEFDVAVTNALLQALMADLAASNHLEGRLSGRLVITKANTQSLRSVSGFGELHLRDGLIWDIPLFGIFSPVLNGISPGLGNSRANAGTSSFVITTGVLRSNDLEIRSTGMRLLYHGTVDVGGNLNARVEAELLRDVWLVGPLVSTIFWPVTKLFEYKVTGTLSQPKSEPVFIVPRLMMLPFLPFRALKGLVPEQQNPGAGFSTVPP